jgi:hypothetical protein
MKQVVPITLLFLVICGTVLLTQHLGGGVALAQQNQIGNFPPPNNGQTALTYQASSNTYHLTRTDGSFSSVLVLDNSMEPGYPNTHDYSTDQVNVDGQRNMATYHYNYTTSSYALSTLLDLDEDSHFLLGAASGAGIGSDPSTGDTCIPANVTVGNNGCSLPNAMHWTIGGTVNKYQGLPTDGNGLSVIAKVINGSATGTVNNYLVWTTPASGYGATDFYEASWVGVVTTASPGASAVAVWNFTDESGPNSCSSGPMQFGAVGNRMDVTCRFYSVPNTRVSVSVVTGGTPTYASHVRVMIH